MELNQVGEVITNFGFPIFLSVYLLVRTEKKLENLTLAINNLNITIQKQEK